MTSTAICSIDGCGKAVYIKPYCRAHYYRMDKFGDPLAGRQHRGSSLALLHATIGHEGDECLIWPYGKDWAGYGSFRAEGVGNTAHRFMCMLAHGQPPEGRNHAAHRCGNRACYNPNHLRWATPKENGEDRVIHGTVARGSETRMAILDEEKVARIRQMIREGVGQVAIAKEFGVGRNTISAISTRRSWAHVK